MRVKNPNNEHVKDVGRQPQHMSSVWPSRAHPLFLLRSANSSTAWARIARHASEVTYCLLE